MRFKMTVKRIEILRAALTELQARLDKGLVNSGLHEETTRILEDQRMRFASGGFHENDPRDVLRALEQINLPEDE